MSFYRTPITYTTPLAMLASAVSACDKTEPPAPSIAGFLKQINCNTDILSQKLIFPSTYVYVDTPYYVRGEYKDLDHDKDVISTVVKYYYHKLLEYWLNTSFIDLLGYVKMDGDKARFISDMTEKTQYADSAEITLKKIMFLKKLLSKKLMKHWLSRYVEKKDVSWYKLQNFETDVRTYIHSKFKSLIEQQI